MIAARGLSRVLAKTSVYFDYGAATAYSVIDYPDEIAAATAQLSTNAAGFARVTIRPLLTAEEMDKAVEKWPPIRIPQEH